MALCACCSKVSTADSLVLGAIQIMIAIFSVFMWYLLLILYIGQIKGVFGTYEPITYKTGCSVWGIIFIISGVSIIRVARHPSPRLLTCTMIMNILGIIVAVIAVVLTVMELSSFESVSYRNYGQAKLGREISRVLLGLYPLELCIAFTYTIFGCVGLTKIGVRNG
ncbi:membrane-spanning 4-domains subfamily A member 13 [Globicephala melas]|uniref:membrane-spanning 4-domains subfamily A member 13 n=1 Tax=Globicephala melas TaxID=9731 RepID=UPI00122F29CA|nr:membrane-spanning 4-domains subfamily A member 13 [Globicephala melas]